MLRFCALSLIATLRRRWTALLSHYVCINHPINFPSWCSGFLHIINSPPFRTGMMWSKTSSPSSPASAPYFITFEVLFMVFLDVELMSCRMCTNSEDYTHLLWRGREENIRKTRLTAVGLKTCWGKKKTEVSQVEKERHDTSHRRSGIKVHQILLRFSSESGLKMMIINTPMRFFFFPFPTVKPHGKLRLSHRAKKKLDREGAKRRRARRKAAAADSWVGKVGKLFWQTFSSWRRVT